MFAHQIRQLRKTQIITKLRSIMLRQFEDCLKISTKSFIEIVEKTKEIKIDILENSKQFKITRHY